jgi:hypothetical protein
MVVTLAAFTVEVSMRNEVFGRLEGKLPICVDPLVTSWVPAAKAVFGAARNVIVVARRKIKNEAAVLGKRRVVIGFMYGQYTTASENLVVDESSLT